MKDQPCTSCSNTMTVTVSFKMPAAGLSDWQWILIKWSVELEMLICRMCEGNATFIPRIKASGALLIRREWPLERQSCTESVNVQRGLSVFAVSFAILFPISLSMLRPNMHVGWLHWLPWAVRRDCENIPNVFFFIFLTMTFGALQKSERASIISRTASVFGAVKGPSADWTTQPEVDVMMSVTDQANIKKLNEIFF